MHPPSTSSSSLSPPQAQPPPPPAPPPSSYQQQQQQLLPLFEEFEAYPFSDDADFRAGLPTVIAAIRGRERTPKQIDEMIARAQWFYFTQLKGVNVPWDAYAEYSLEQLERPTHLPPSSTSAPSPLAPISGVGSVTASTSASPNASPRSASLSSNIPGAGSSSSGNGSGNGNGGSLSKGKGKASIENGLAQLNSLAEARRMMQAPQVGVNESDQGMSFAMLCRLISEGRASEVSVGTVNVPDAINEEKPSDSVLPSRAKPWETSPPSSANTVPSLIHQHQNQHLQHPQLPQQPPLGVSPSMHSDPMMTSASAFNPMYLIDPAQSTPHGTPTYPPYSVPYQHPQPHQISPLPNHQHPLQLQQQQPNPLAHSHGHSHNHQHPQPHSHALPNSHHHMPLGIPVTPGQQLSVSPSAPTPFLDPQTASTPLFSLDPATFLADPAMRAEFLESGEVNGDEPRYPSA